MMMQQAQVLIAFVQGSLHATNSAASGLNNIEGTTTTYAEGGAAI